MRTRRIAGVLVAGAIAVAVAPAAPAWAGDIDCSSRGGAQLCQKPGHSSLHADPPPVLGGPTAGGLFDPSWMPGFGRLTGIRIG